MYSTPTERLRKALAIPIAVAIVLAIAAFPALGEKGDNPGRGSGEGREQPTIRSECDPCALGQDIRFSGEGYDPRKSQVMIDLAGVGAFAEISADGTISFSWSQFSGAGQHAINVYVKRNRSKSDLVASMTLTLVEPSGGDVFSTTTAVVSETTTTVNPTTTTTDSTSASSTTTTEASATSTVPPTTTTAPQTSTTLSPSRQPRVLVFDETTTITNETITLRPGDRIELLNGARLIFGEGATLDAQGSDTWSWTWDGENAESISYNAERDVQIKGQGHLMWMAGSLPATLRNVEVDVQPDLALGHYPLHWHRVGDDSRGTIVENVIVKNSTNRAFVPHASHGIAFRDVAAINTVDSAFWWDPPGTTNCDSAWRRFCTADNSDDTTVSRLLVSGVVPPGDSRGFRLAGVELGAGSGNAIVDSVVVDIKPNAVKDCAAYQWPESANRNEGGNTWVFRQNFGESSCHGIFVWQNDSSAHVIDGFSGGGIDHGAYANAYLYRNVSVPYVEVHAEGWRIEDSVIGTVLGRTHQSSGRVDFARVRVGSVVVDDAGGEAIDYVFSDSDVSCADIVWKSTAGSRVIIDGMVCP